jgi:predicted negative regulator of RcsB-dependent stress response
MARYKRIPRTREKQADDFINWADHIYVWIYDRRRHVMPFTVVCVLALVAAFGFWGYVAHQNAKAADLFQAAEANTTGSDAQAAGLEKVIKEFPKTRSGYLAGISLGNLWFSKGDTDKAALVLEPLTTVSNRYGAIRILALHDMAEGYEQKGDFKKASDYYLRAYHDPVNPLKAFSYYEAARCLAQAGDRDGAKKIFQEILDNGALDNPTIHNKSEEGLIWLQVQSAPRS